MITVPTLMPWIDLLWIPIAIITMERGKKIKTALFAGGCVLLLRLQVELLQQVGFGAGFFHWLAISILQRGMITYACFILFFLIIAYYSPGTNNHVHMAASIGILILAFCVSTFVMVL